MSERSKEQWELLEYIYDRLTAQISVYAGKRDGGLATLQDLIHKYDADLPIVCEACKRQLSSMDGHAEDCAIVQHYLTLFTNSPDEAAK